MKVKLAIIFGIIIWALSYALSAVFGPIFTEKFLHIDIIIPIISIIVTGFFGILYIRNIETNEVVEGILVGIAFVIIDIILDMIFFVLPNVPNPMFANYTIHILSVLVITLSITTLLGYLAQMKIDLK